MVYKDRDVLLLIREKRFITFDPIHFTISSFNPNSFLINTPLIKPIHGMDDLFLIIFIRKILMSVLQEIKNSGNNIYIDYLNDSENCKITSDNGSFILIEPHIISVCPNIKIHTVDGAIVNGGSREELLSTIIKQLEDEFFIKLK